MRREMDYNPYAIHGYGKDDVRLASDEWRSYHAQQRRIRQQGYCDVPTPEEIEEMEREYGGDM